MSSSKLLGSSPNVTRTNLQTVSQGTAAGETVLKAGDRQCSMLSWLDGHAHTSGYECVHKYKPFTARGAGIGIMNIIENADVSNCSMQCGHCPHLPKTHMQASTWEHLRAYPYIWHITISVITTPLCNNRTPQLKRMWAPRESLTDWSCLIRQLQGCVPLVPPRASSNCLSAIPCAELECWWQGPPLRPVTRR